VLLVAPFLILDRRVGVWNCGIEALWRLGCTVRRVEAKEVRDGFVTARVYMMHVAATRRSPTVWHFRSRQLSKTLDPNSDADLYNF
jgi:hypothetical protein